MEIVTANGPVEIELVHCEVTNNYLGWKTVLNDDEIKMGCTSAYISFAVVSEDGTPLVDTSDIEVF